MSETELLSKSKNKVKSIKRNKAEYIHLIMAILNFLTIISIFTLIRNKTLLSSLIGLFFVVSLLIGTIFTFLKGNPYYIYFCFGLTLCGVLGFFLGVSTFPFLLIIFIPQVMYIYSLIEYDVLIQGRSADLHIVTEPYTYIFPRKTQKQVSDENRRQEIEENERRNLEKKFKFNSIVLISLCFSIGLFITLIFSA